MIGDILYNVNGKFMRKFDMRKTDAMSYEPMEIILLKDSFYLVLIAHSFAVAIILLEKIVFSLKSGSIQNRKLFETSNRIQRFY